MNIPLHVLETLSTFYDVKTLAKTAEILKTTQPTISRRFHELQKESSILIFETRGRKKVLTEYGEALARLAAKRLSGIAGDIAELSNEYKNPKQYHLTVSGRAELLRMYLSKIDVPAAVTLIASNSNAISASIRSCTYDVVVSQESIDTAFYIKKKFVKERWFLVIPKKFGVYPNLEKWSAAANRWPFACYDSNNRFLNGIIKELGFSDPPQVRFEFSDWGAVAERIDLGFNWGILPESFLPGRGNIQAIHLEQVAPTVFFIYFKTHLRKQPWFVSWLDRQNHLLTN